jgi:hypothetical protein
MTVRSSRRPGLSRITRVFHREGPTRGVAKSRHSRWSRGSDPRLPPPNSGPPTRPHIWGATPCIEVRACHKVRLTQRLSGHPKERLERRFVPGQFIRPLPSALVDRGRWRRLCREGRRRPKARLRLLQGGARPAIGRQAPQQKRGPADRGQRGEAAGVGQKQVSRRAANRLTG